MLVKRNLVIKITNTQQAFTCPKSTKVTSEQGATQTQQYRQITSIYTYYTYIHTYTYTYIYTYAHTHIHIYIYIYPQTHIRANT